MLNVFGPNLSTVGAPAVIEIPDSPKHTGRGHRLATATKAYRHPFQRAKE